MTVTESGAVSTGDQKAPMTHEEIIVALGRAEARREAAERDCDRWREIVGLNRTFVGDAIPALKAAHFVLDQLIQPNMETAASHLYFQAIEADIKIRKAIGLVPQTPNADHQS